MRLCAIAALVILSSNLCAQTLPGTKPLTMEGDIASTMIDGIDKFLLRELEKSIAKRGTHWNRDFTDKATYDRSVDPNRKRLAHLLGVRDARHEVKAIRFEATTSQSHLVGQSRSFKAYSVSWPVLRDITGRGLLLVPQGNIRANVVAIPDADQTPEQIAGLTDGVAADSQFARKLAQSGCQVLIPTLIDRQEANRRGRAKLTSREYVHRPAYELGRHIIGYEIQKVLAGVDWFARTGKGVKIGVVGYGEGGMTAFYAAALDTRIQAACVMGYFGSRQSIWDQPIDRNVFALLEQFGDAEIATLIFPRQLIVEPSKGPEVTLKGNGGAPAKLASPKPSEVSSEARRAGELVRTAPAAWSRLRETRPGADQQFGSDETIQAFHAAINAGEWNSGKEVVKHLRDQFDPAPRQQSQMTELVRHNQWLLSESPFVRNKFMSKLDKSSLEKYKQSVESYRDIFRHEVIGHFDIEPLPANPRTRLIHDKPKWRGYQVVLDVFPDVFAYGVLLLPKDIKPGEKRPVVVCQHGLEGRPKDVIEGDQRAYHDFAAKLAERGFITFAPQNIYIFRDRFRTLQRKAYPLKKTLFSIMVPQHQQIVDWLETLPSVDPKRIAFYGLSYGGKSAMRIPPLVTDYCLSICSADFNEWVRKNASTQHGFSYVWTGEYEIFEWDLGSTFNYAEMAALICPRPFMVERGHFDGVGKDEWVAYEFAKVRHLYAAQLFIPDRCEIEWFYGPYKGIHTINGQGTYDFLHRHLKWPKPKN